MKDWGAHDRLAAEHRLQPLLYSRWRDESAIPAGVRASWAEAYRASAVAALVQRRDLLVIAETLSRAGIEALALKGAWLAWHCYAAPAERPLRDLDLLVRREQAVAAQEMLLAEGFVQDDHGALPLAEWAARFKHLPPLVSPQGTVVEIHARLWDEDSRNPPQATGLFERAIADPDQSLHYIAPPDMLSHLAVHAAFHRFDGGPLMLVDFERLVAAIAFDWPAVWRRATSERWDKPLALALRGADHWIAPGLLAGTGCPEVPQALLDDLPLLLAKPQAERVSDIVAAKLACADISVGEKLRRIAARRARFGGTRDWLGWLAGESRAALRGRASRRSTAIARLDRWLTG